MSSLNRPKSIQCPVCKMTSWNPNDVAHGYCGNCHAYTGQSLPPHQMTDAELRAGVNLFTQDDPPPRSCRYCGVRAMDVVAGYASSLCSKVPGSEGLVGSHSYEG